MSLPLAVQVPGASAGTARERSDRAEGNIKSLEAWASNQKTFTGPHGRCMKIIIYY